MIGFVLAAGFGTRLKEITEMIPKALVPVCGVPLIEIALRYYRKNGIETLGANLHYHSEILQMFVEKLPYKVALYDEQPEILGTGGAIYNAKEFLATDDSFAVLNADIVTNAPLKEYIERFEKSDAICALVSSTDGKSTISSSSGSYAGIVGSEFSDADASSAFVGLALYKKKALEYFTADDFSVVPVWKRMAEAGECVEVWSDKFYWKDTGTPQSIGELYRDILDKKIKFDFPLGVSVDFEKKIGCFGGISPDIIDNSSEYLWVENVFAPGKITGRNAILLSGVAVDSSKKYKDSLVTPWCEVALGE